MRPVPGRLVLAANAAWNLVNFRSELIGALVEAGWEVVAAAPPDSVAEAKLKALGCRFAPVPIDSKGLSPARDLGTFVAFRDLLRRERPAAFLGWTVKPNTYGMLAARLSGVQAIANISGLGTVFIRRTWVTRVVRGLYRLGLAKARTVFFQNGDDRDLFVGEGMVRPGRARLLPGSGIDTARFAAAPDPGNAVPRFLLIARMVRDKGVLEFVDAARMLRGRGVEARFQLLGFLDVENRTAVARAEVEAWVTEGVVEYLGPADDVRPFVAAADCVVLPSYREGTSRVLLEAAAMARPLVATDVPGCREVVDDGVTGFLCHVRDAGSLADAMERVVRLTPEARGAMGRAGRAKVEREFDVAVVVAAYLEALRAAGLRPLARARAAPNGSGKESVMEQATLAGGCFWCTEAIFKDVIGVAQVESGYIGGQVVDPTYRQVCDGNTGHAEAVRVTFDPEQIGLDDVLDIFFATHEPTQLNRQGNDVGTQYRSAIFPHDAEQEAAARRAIERANAENGGRVVTTIEPLSTWYPAEDYHQDYFDREGGRNPYCMAVIAPKLRKFRKSYTERAKSMAAAA